jgi:hypothetical protein
MDPLRMTDPMEAVTDRSIRRALGFAGLAIGVVMLALSFDLLLALRIGADLVAVTAVVVLLAAWHSPRRDMRDSECWVMLNEMLPEFVRGRPKKEMQRRLQEVLRRRLLWHAERLGVLAVALWSITLVGLAVRAF